MSADPLDVARDDAADLAQTLRSRIEGEVRFAPGDRALYATDLSVYRQVPIGVVIPRTLDDVIATVATCRRNGVPILGRGCGTSLAGQTCNVAVVIDFSKYLNRIEEIDPEAKRATVLPGVICEELRGAAARHGLTFPADPATHEYCTLGGMIGNNSCGAHTVMGGKTVDNTEELEILTYDGQIMRVGRTGEEESVRLANGAGREGEIYSRLRAIRDRYAEEIRQRYPNIPRRVSGYNLDSLLPENGFDVAKALVGSESTCALTLRAHLRLVPSPPCRSLLLVGCRDYGVAGDHTLEIRGLGPTALEAVHTHVLENLRRSGQNPPGAALYPEGRTWLLVEFGGATQKEADAAAAGAAERIRGLPGITGVNHVSAPQDQTEAWAIRKNCVGASRVPGVEESWPAWEDSAVDPAKLGDYLRDLGRLLDRHGYNCTLFGHFGDGCVHSRIDFDFRTDDGVARFRSFMEEAADLVLSYGGSLSGEHGDGQARAELLPKMFGPDLMQAFREFKSIWDPDWKMNPGKLIDANRMTSNLRMGPDYSPQPVHTYFEFPEDQGSFAHAVERCFGVGRCRKTDGATMCPSFQATREEKYTTRGRAHLLFEMLRGDAIEDAWQNETVHDALDLCLQCKGCKHDCPVSVDMATYKAEFMAHYYEHRPQPRAAWTMGRLYRWLPLARMAPGIVNLVMDAPLAGAAAKLAAGASPRRELPEIAETSFQTWFRRRRPDRQGAARRGSVVLWPDTFTNHFESHIAEAAVEVLEAAGYRVVVPSGRVCCGRTLYEHGSLDEARGLLHRTLDVLRPELRAGLPIIGLEPSCVSVFRDELTSMLPHDADARRLSRQAHLFSEFLAGQDDWRPPRLDRRAVVHVHCHQKSVLDANAQERLFRGMGIDCDMLDTGCCGVAGGFGYEHYDVSMKIGEQALLPAVRAAPAEALIVSDGFSCRSQISHATRRRALHTAEVLRTALEGAGETPRFYPEAASRRRPARVSGGEMVAAGLMVAGAAAATAAVWRAYRRR